MGGAGAGLISLGWRLATVLVGSACGLYAGADEIQITHIAKDLLSR